MRWASLLLFAAQVAVAAPRATADHERVVLGEDAEVLLRVASSAPLRASASSGALERVSSDGGEQVFRWTPPEVRFPGFAVLLFWEAASPRPDVASVVLPLVGRTSIEMDTEPFADVRVRVAGQLFGPVKANPRGRVKVPIEVPPGVHSAQVEATAKGLQTSRTVPLEVPDTSPFAIAAGPSPLPASGDSTIWLLAQSAPGSSGTGLKASAVGARIGPARVDGERTSWQGAPNGSSRRVQLSVRASDGGEQTLTLDETAGPSLDAVGGPAGAPEPPHLVPELLVGGFFSGGANLGPRLEGGVAARAPGFPQWLSIELSTGARTLSLTGNPGGLGRTRSSIWVLPLELDGRGRVWRRGPLAVDLRGGAGALFFRHTFEAPLQPEYAESGVGFDAFAAADGTWRAGPVEWVLELRGSWSQVRTPHLLARPGGLALSVGARWVGPGGGP